MIYATAQDELDSRLRARTERALWIVIEYSGVSSDFRDVLNEARSDLEKRLKGRALNLEKADNAVKRAYKRLISD